MNIENTLDGLYDPVTLFGKPALFTNLRVDRDMIPEILYAYDIRHGDNGIAVTVEKHVLVNHMGTVITAEPLDFGGAEYIRIDDESGDLDFVGEHDCNTIAEYQAYLLELGQAEKAEPEQASGLTMNV
ncbi:hypothetical protein LJC63_01980 [Ruminococcaceae bacterium OttesenSCG-928-L11]|nr:hypothetical protein [Ruminococcaceae bacterium OttesenSCG-928-L11]